MAKKLTVNDVVAHIGVKRLAALLGVLPINVRHYMRQGSFPASWRAVIASEIKEIKPSAQVSDEIFKMRLKIKGPMPPRPDGSGT